MTVDVLALDAPGLTLTSVGTPAQGTAVDPERQDRLHGAGQLTSGPDSFTYTVTDGNGLTGQGSVGITVQAVAPVANPVTATVAENGSALINVLPSDSGTGIRLTGVGTPVTWHGGAAAGADSLHSFTTDYAGADALTYTITGVSGATAQGSVAVTVTSRDRAGGEFGGGDGDHGAVCHRERAGAGCAGPDAHGGGHAGAGHRHRSRTGSILYTAPAGYVGPDSFSYTVTDGNGLTGQGSVAVTVQAVPPVANPLMATVAENGTVLISVSAER